MGFSEKKSIYKKQNAIIKRSKLISKILYITRYIFIVCAVLLAISSICLFTGIFNLDSNILVLGRIAKIMIPFRHFHSFLGERIGEIGYYAIYYMFTSIVALVTAFQINYFYKAVKYWANGNSPFNSEQIKQMRIISVFLSVVMFFFQPLYLLFGTTLFISTFLMDYGNVLEEEAVNLIHSHEQIVLSLAETIEYKSGKTGMHVKRVSEYSKVIAEGLGLNTNDVDDIKIASMLHDVGKLLVSKEIFQKTGELTQDEVDQMKKHTKYGYNMLLNTTGSVLEKAKLIAREHHEKWDGTGYEGKSGVRISTAARIVAVADMYDKLSSKHSYKDSMALNQDKIEIESRSGTYFDPQIVKVFSNNYDKILSIRSKYPD